MSYLVLARKYRPQTFADVVGQEHVTRTLANAFDRDRVHHAFLFCGPRGVGKTTAARILGKALNCVKGPTPEPCGECESCTTITAGSAVDYFEMDGASNRGIDAIRELREAVRYQPAALRKKVYVIDEVHMLTTEAFNALLKTLEEPPPHVTFVLATTEPHKLPNTILSRCQRYDFKLVPMARLIQHLERIFRAESIEFEPAALALIARESGGSVRDALSLADQVISFAGESSLNEVEVAQVLGVADRALTRSIVTGLASGDSATALESVDAAVARGVDEVQIARAVVRYLRDLAVLQVAPGLTGLIDGSDDERAELAEQAGQIEPGRVTQMFERMIRACDDLGETQLPRLVLDLALIEVAGLRPLLPLGDLLERLEQLEHSLGPAPRGGGTPSGRGGRRTAEGAASPAGSTGATRAAPLRAAPSSQAEAPPAARAAVKQPEPQRPVVFEAPATNGKATSDPAVEPSSASGDAAVSVDDRADGMARWEGIISALEDEKRLSLVAVFQEARLLAWADDEVVVGFRADSLNAAIAADRDNVVAVQSFLTQRCGRPMTFRVQTFSESEAAAQSQRSLVELDAERAKRTRSQRERELREHPITKLVLSTFEAEIKEIKTDG